MSKIIGNTTAVPKALTEDEVITLVTGSEEVQELIKELGGDGAPQVQADWEQTNQDAVDYIKNKPDFDGLEATVDDLQTRVLPDVTVADNGKSLQVVDGVWQTKVIQGGGGGGADPIRRITLNGSGDEALSLTFDDNTIYDISGYSNITFTCPTGDYNAYFYIALPSVDDVSITLPGNLSKAGDNINRARGGDTWEISIDSSLGILSLNVRAINYE